MSPTPGPDVFLMWTVDDHPAHITFTAANEREAVTVERDQPGEIAGVFEPSERNRIDDLPPLIDAVPSAYLTESDHEHTSPFQITPIPSGAAKKSISRREAACHTPRLSETVGRERT